MKAVDARQMRGFQSYGVQAFNLLQNGDATGAAKAMYAAYQYFPNGSDVKFGVQKGANGQPVLIGMGTDEKTGEPLKEGKPMVITPESLSVQMENMQNPDAFRTWTKDWRDTEQEVREYMEGKSQRQADLDLTGAQTQYYRDRGTAALLDASTPGGGLKQSDIDRNIAAFEGDRELQALLGGTEEAAARDLTEAMATLFITSGTNNRSSVIKFIMDSYNEGGMEQVNEDLAQIGAR
jgi:hypothetical protein